MKIINCITIGDERGIGLELIFKIWSIYKDKTKTFFLLGDYNKIYKVFKKYNHSFSLKKISYPEEARIYFNKFLPIINITTNNYENSALNALKKSYKYANQKLITGIVTLPLNKSKIKLINKNFTGHTEFFERIDKSNTNMIFVSNKIIISPLTTHIPIKKIKFYINKQYLRTKITSLINSLKNDLRINNPKIAISGLNPHSGENGKIGNEEKKIIYPVIKEFNNKGYIIDGPISGDTIFLNHNIKNYDCILTMFHDQALIPFKIFSFKNGINFTSGLSFVRTSPCHGTAYDMVGKNIASEKSLYNAIILSNKIYNNRKNAKKISRSKFFK